jgi:opacity protein-like surface antigen
MLKVNMMIGNLNPDSRITAYGLFGGGLQYFDFESFDFTYNRGAGASYKLTSRTGLNINLEYNDLGSGNYRYYGYEYESESDSFYTLTAGISYFMK